MCQDWCWWVKVGACAEVELLLSVAVEGEERSSSWMSGAASGVCGWADDAIGGWHHGCFLRIMDSVLGFGSSRLELRAELLSSFGHIFDEMDIARF